MSRVYLALIVAVAAVVGILWLSFGDGGLTAGLGVVALVSLMVASGEAKRVNDGTP